jgi:hypothetical protein
MGNASSQDAPHAGGKRGQAAARVSDLPTDLYESLSLALSRLVELK